MSDMGNKIRYLRQENKLSLQKLADLVGCSKPHIFEIEKGKASPTFDKITKIALIFKVPLTFFNNEELNMNTIPTKTNDILQYFTYEHLPEHLKQTSKQFGMLAEWMHINLPDCAEKSAGLRKLLEAKDCAVRAKLANAG